MVMKIKQMKENVEIKGGMQHILTSLPDICCCPKNHHEIHWLKTVLFLMNLAWLDSPGQFSVGNLCITVDLATRTKVIWRSEWLVFSIASLLTLLDHQTESGQASLGLHMDISRWFSWASSLRLFWAHILRLLYGGQLPLEQVLPEIRKKAARLLWPCLESHKHH